MSPKLHGVAVLFCFFNFIALGPTFAEPREPSCQAQVGQRPNIVYILADDFGTGDLQALHPDRSKIATPNLDQFVAQGMRFRDAHSGSSVCTPTRYGLLTGRYAWRTRLQRGVLDGTDDPPLIEADRLTVASYLKQQGYTTAAIGKWHLGFDSLRPEASNVAGLKSKKENKGKTGEAGLPVGTQIIDGPITRGFDYFWGCSNARTMSSLIENDRVVENLSPTTMLPRLGKRAVQFIEEHSAGAKQGNPFFLYVPLTSPHTPILPTPDWQGKSGLGSYGDFVMQSDAVVGDLLAALDKGQVSGNTIVIFTADNGCSPAAGTNDLEKSGHFASGHYRGYKADIWEGGHRVPFIVRWPGKVIANSVSDQTICHVDLMATCADVLGRRLPDEAGVDSVSFLPALLGTDNAPLREATVHHSIDGAFAIRQGNWKLCLCSGSGGWGSPREVDASKQGLPSIQLYDLSKDISESKNIQADNQEVVSRLMSLLDQYVALGRSTPGNIQANDVEINLRKMTKKK